MFFIKLVQLSFYHYFVETFMLKKYLTNEMVSYRNENI